MGVRTESGPVFVINSNTRQNRINNLRRENMVLSIRWMLRVMGLRSMSSLPEQQLIQLVFHTVIGSHLRSVYPRFFDNITEMQ
jgi:hypothetical protein